MPKKLFAALAAALFLLSGCAKDVASTTYTTGATSGKVLKGTIISARPVTIKEHDKLADNGTGGLLGGAIGGVGGNAFGNNSGNTAATVGGAIVGAVAGAMVEDALSTTDGMEYLVQIDGKHARKAGPQHKKIVRATTKGSVEDDINNSIDTDMETDMVSVVQKADPALGEGSKVYVVYNNDRPRLVPRKNSAK